MPIKGLTDRQESFAEIGKIHKGSPKQKNQNGIEIMGKDLNYFRVEFDPRDTDAITKFKEAYGDEPQILNVFLPFDDLSREWDAFYEAYTAGQMIARADGEHFLRKINPKTGQVEVMNGEPLTKFDKTEPVGHYTSKGQQVPIYARPIGRLRVIIPELRRLAYLTLQTTSIYDVINISGELEAISTLCFGRIAGVPLLLKRVPRMISCPNKDGSRTRREKWLISIEANPKWVGKKIDAMNALSFPAETAIGLLPAGAVAEVNDPQGAINRAIEQAEQDGVPDEQWDPEDADPVLEGVFAENPAEPAPVAPIDQPQVAPSTDPDDITLCKFEVAKVEAVAKIFDKPYKEVNDILLLCKLDAGVSDKVLVSWCEAYRNGIKRGKSPQQSADAVNPK